MKLQLKVFLQRYWPILVLIAAPLVLFAPILLGRVWYWGVPLLQFYPWQQMAAESYQAGQLPLWNSLVGNGAPLAANLQTGAFYPLNFLYLLLPTEYAMGYTAILHVILAGLFMYGYLRTMKLSMLAAVIGALAFEMNGFLIARAGFFSVTAAVPWLAAWLWRAEKLYQRMREAPGGPPTNSVGYGQGGGMKLAAARDALWLALMIGFGILAGHAQTAVYGLVFVSFYFLWRTFSNRTSLQLSIPRSLMLFAIAILLGLGLAAIQLLPAAELTRESQRAGGLDYTKIMTHSFWPLRLLTMLSPDFFGNPAQNTFWGYDNYWENAAYIGLIPLLLALYAIWKRLRRQATYGPIGFLATAAVVSLLLACGWFTPIYPFLYRTVPGFALFQGPARWLIVTVVALCALAGFGMQQLLDQGVSRKAATRLILVGLALSLAGLAASFVLKGRVETFGPATLRLGALLILAGLLFQAKIHQPKTQLVFVAVVALDLITAQFALNPTLSPDIYHAPNPTAEALRADGSIGRVFFFAEDEEAIKFGKYLAHKTPEGKPQFDGFGPNDLDFWLNERAALLPNAAMIDRVPAANNFDSLIVGRYQSLLDRIEALPLEQVLPVLSQMHVGYIVSPRNLNLPIVTRTPDVTVYRNDQVLPRAWVAAQDVDVQNVATIMPGSAIESLTDSGNTVTIRASLPQAGWLILSDTFYPGWQAAVDGLPTEIQVANTAFRAVQVPPGAHTIEFRYEPRSVSIGLLVSLVCLVIIIVGLIVSHWRGQLR
jgi:hypothetical protein